MDAGGAFSEALARFQRGDLAGAEAGLRALIATHPAEANAHHLLAGVLHARGDLTGALAFFARAAALAPADAGVAFNHAACLMALERHGEAVAAYDAFLRLAPNDPDALYNRAVALAALKRHAEALAAYDAARAAGFRAPGGGDALAVNRGVALAALGRLEEALASFDAALAADGGDVKAHVNRGAALDGLERFEEAVAAYDAALARAPDHAKAWMQRAAALADLGRFEEALASAARARALAPARRDLMSDQAALLIAAERGDEAIASLEAMRADAPDDPDLRYAAAYCHLRNGDFARGLPLYEARWQAAHGPRAAPRDEAAFRAAPLWLGREEIAGKRLLVRGEQGYGDLFQFCRFVPEIARRGAHVIVQERPQVLDLLRSLEGVRECIAHGDPLPPFDFHMPMVSAPLALGVTLETIPARTPYLRAPPDRVTAWRARLPWRGRPRVGFAWRGGAHSRFQRRRSLSSAALAALLEGRADWVSLQTDPGEAAALLADSGARDFGEDIRPFTEFAALIESLDLVVSIDTSVAHLAGALDKPVLLLLPMTAEWRWLREREDTPWYPKTRLLRQQRFGDWSAPIAAAHGAIAAFQP